MHDVWTAIALPKILALDILDWRTMTGYKIRMVHNPGGLKVLNYRKAVIAPSNHSLHCMSKKLLVPNLRKKSCVRSVYQVSVSEV